MHFLVAPDSFKGTFGAHEVAEAIAVGVEAAGSEADRCPVADGGEGTMEVLLGALGGERQGAQVGDPLRRPIAAEFALLDDGETAVVETARACGLTLVAPGDRDPERADTYGAGELIAAAIDAGAQRVLVAVGGSATTDGGEGAIEALRDRGALEDAVRLEVLCDVTTAFEDAAQLFAPQKGAGAMAVERLDRRLEELAAELPRDPRGVPMSGCAGGLSGGLWAHGAKLRSGAAFVLDAVLGGEGRLDSQSLSGKVVGEIAARSARAGKPLHLIVGHDALGTGAPSSFYTVAEAESLEEMRGKASEVARER